MENNSTQNEKESYFCTPKDGKMSTPITLRCKVWLYQVFRLLIT